MRSDNKALSAVQDALGLGAATVDTMYTALNATVDVVSEIKAKLVAARTPGVDRGKIQSEISELQSQLRNTADSAVFNGENWLSYDSSAASYNATKNDRCRLLAGRRRRFGGYGLLDLTQIELYDDADQTGILDRAMVQSDGAGGTVAVSTGVSVANLDISALTDNAADLAVMEELIGGVDFALGQITDAATNLGAIKNRNRAPAGLREGPDGPIRSRRGQLVDADMNAESTRLQALQTQQQLGIQAITIANFEQPEHPLAVPLIARTDPVSGPPGPAPSWSGGSFRRCASAARAQDHPVPAETAIRSRSPRGGGGKGDEAAVREGGPSRAAPRDRSGQATRTGCPSVGRPDDSLLGIDQPHARDVLLLRGDAHALDYGARLRLPVEMDREHAERRPFASPFSRTLAQ